MQALVNQHAVEQNGAEANMAQSRSPCGSHWVLASMPAVGKGAEEARGSTRRLTVDPMAHHIHGKLNAGTSSTFFFNMPADLTPGLEMVVVLRQSRLKASGKESCGRTTSDENIPFSLGGSGKTFLNSAQI